LLINVLVRIQDRDYPQGQGKIGDVGAVEKVSIAFDGIEIYVSNLHYSAVTGDFNSHALTLKLCITVFQQPHSHLLMAGVSAQKTVIIDNDYRE